MVACFSGLVRCVDSVTLLLELAVAKKITEKQLGEQKHLIDRFPYIFQNIQNVSKADFAGDELVDCRRANKNCFKILDLSEHLEAMRKFPGADRYEQRASMDALLADILPHVRVGTESVKDPELRVIDTIAFPGAYFPSIHTDLEWDLYPNDGFQIWYLTENEEKDNLGNMFLFPTDRVLNSASSNLSLQEGDIIVQRANNELDKRVAEFPASELKDKIRYLDMRPGECLVFSSWTYHMSDFRVPNPKRHAVTARILVCPEGKMLMDRSAVKGLSAWHFWARTWWFKSSPTGTGLDVASTGRYAGAQGFMPYTG